MALPEPSEIAFLFTGIVAGVFAILTTATNKSNKISEFRYSWISEKKRYCSDFLTYCFEYRKMKIRQLDGDDEVTQKQLDEIVREVNRITSILKMSLNSKEEKVERMLSLKNKIITNITGLKKNKKKIRDYAGLVDSYREVSYEYFKEEWERVKKGEMAYRATYTVCVFSFVFVILFSAFYSALYYGDKELLEKFLRASYSYVETFFSSIPIFFEYIGTRVEPRAWPLNL